MIEAMNSDESSDFVFFETKSLNVHTAMTMAKASTPFIPVPLVDPRTCAHPSSGHHAVAASPDSGYYHSPQEVVVMGLAAIEGIFMPLGVTLLVGALSLRPTGNGGI